MDPAVGPLMHRLDAAAAALTSCGAESASGVAAIHFKAFVEELQQVHGLRLQDLARLSDKIIASGCWPPPYDSKIQQVLSAQCAGGTKRRSMQDFENLLFYLTDKKWDQLQDDDVALADKIKIIIMLAYALGARCPSEPSKVAWATLLAKVHREHVPVERMRSLLTTEWKRFCRTQTPPVVWIDKLPPSPAAAPQLLYRNALGSDVPAQPRISESELLLEARASRCRGGANPSPKSSAMVPAHAQPHAHMYGAPMNDILMKSMVAFMGAMKDMVQPQRAAADAHDRREEGAAGEMPPPRKKQQVQRGGEIEIEIFAPGGKGGAQGAVAPKAEAGADEATAAPVGTPAICDAGDAAAAVREDRMLEDGGKNGEGGEGGADAGTTTLIGALAARDVYRTEARKLAKRDEEGGMLPAAKAGAKAKGKAKAGGKAKGKATPKAKGVPKKGAARGTASANDKREVVEARLGSGAGSSKCFAWKAYGGKAKAMAAAYMWIDEQEGKAKGKK